MKYCKIALLKLVQNSAYSVAVNGLAIYGCNYRAGAQPVDWG